MARLLAAVAVCAIASISLSAGRSQDPQQRPVFRGGAIFVNVDAYPRRDGKVVEGLTKTDFEVFEDGKPQAVENFEFVRVEPNTPDNELRDPSSVQDSLRQAADPHNRIFVVFLDVFHTTVFGSHYAREPILGFLQRAIGPRDLFGVMTPELPVNALTFGRRTETLNAELLNNWDWGEAGRSIVVARNDTERKLQMCGRTPAEGDGLVLAFREDLTASSLEALMVRLDNLRDERKNILFISEGWAPTRGNPVTTSGGQPARIPGVGVGPNGKLGLGTAGKTPGEMDMAWCNTQVARLTTIDYDRRFKDLLDRARLANVAFYPVDVGGLRAESGAVVTRRMDVLHELAINTDGEVVINTNDLKGGVRKIADDLSAYYLLGYYTSNTAADGKYRRIEVKVKTQGVKVSARRGYLAPTEEIRKAEAAAATRPVKDTSTVDLELARLARLETDASIFTAAVRSKAGLSVIVEIAGQEFGRGAWNNGAAVKVSVTPSGGAAEPVTAEGRIEPGARSAIVQVPLAAPGSNGWRIRTRIETGGAGAATIDDDVTVTPAALPIIGEPTAFRAGTGARSPLRAVADYKFFRTERIHVEWPVSKPLEERSARLLNRRGDPMPVPVTLTERGEGDALVLAADLVLAPLAAGDYIIELTATSGGDKLQRLLAFRMLR